MPVKRMLINFPSAKAAVHDDLRKAAQDMGVSMTRVAIEAMERFLRNPGAGIKRPGKKKGGRP